MSMYTKMLFRALLLCAALVYAGPSCAEGLKLNLIGDSREILPFRTSIERVTRDCGVRVYAISRHLNTEARYNEENTGAGIECYWSAYGNGWYWHAGRLSNSYACLTNVAGIGYKAPLLRYGQFVAGVGLEMDYLKYCVPGHERNGVWIDKQIAEGGPLPFPFAFLGYGNAHVNVYMLKANPGIYLVGFSYMF